ncbi:hypothetical protein GCM10007052_07590 [Halioglobus japonicus]|nr:hypothetical protein GCM10007052_07590 [Halioglobus japonicus]
MRSNPTPSYAAAVAAGAIHAAVSKPSLTADVRLVKKKLAKQRFSSLQNRLKALRIAGNNIARLQIVLRAIKVAN